MNKKIKYVTDELGGELITIGSDAHIPQRVGCGFKEVKELLKNITSDESVTVWFREGTYFIENTVAFTEASPPASPLASPPPQPANNVAVIAKHNNNAISFFFM